MADLKPIGTNYPSVPVERQLNPSVDRLLINTVGPSGDASGPLVVSPVAPVSGSNLVFDVRNGTGTVLTVSGSGTTTIARPWTDGTDSSWSNALSLSPTSAPAFGISGAVQLVIGSGINPALGAGTDGVNNPPTGSLMLQTDGTAWVKTKVGATSWLKLATISDITWRSVTGPTEVATDLSLSVAVAVYLVDTSAERTLTLPSPDTATDKLPWLLIDAGNNAAAKPITLVRFGSETIDGISGNKNLNISGGRWWVWTDGTNWYTAPCLPITAVDLQNAYDNGDSPAIVTTSARGPLAISRAGVGATPSLTVTHTGADPSSPIASFSSDHEEGYVGFEGAFGGQLRIRGTSIGATGTITVKPDERILIGEGFSQGYNLILNAGDGDPDDDGDGGDVYIDTGSSGGLGEPGTISIGGTLAGAIESGSAVTPWTHSGHIAFVTQPADPASVADQVLLYAKDSAGTRKLYAQDPDGTVHEVTARAPIQPPFVVDATTAITLDNNTRGGTLYCTSNDPVDVTVHPFGLDPGYWCAIIQAGAGQVTVIGDTMTVRVQAGLLPKTEAQWARIVVTVVTGSDAVVSGDLDV